MAPGPEPGTAPSSPSTSPSTPPSARPLFVALRPDAPTIRRLADLDLGPEGMVRRVAPEDLHVTLRYLGPIDAGVVPTLVAALGQVADRAPAPVRGTLGPATRWFTGGRALHVPVSGLDDLAADVRASTAALVPVPVDELPFVGHLTVARARRAGPDGAWRAALAGLPCTAVFDATTLDLVASASTTTGPRYTDVVRVPFS